MIQISVIIPTYNPNKKRLESTLQKLKGQLFNINNWELIIVDNNSTNNFSNGVDIAWHPAGKIVFEPNQGLTFARLRGFEESKGDIIVLVDDDNLLEPNYLDIAFKIFEQYSSLGTAGGNSVGKFETQPEEWMAEFYGMIAVRTSKNQISISSDLNNGYPILAPIGAGMCIRRNCFKFYYDFVKQQKGIIKDRTGNNLSSGGDNEINIVALKNSFCVGFFSELNLTHLIPTSRIETSYLKKLNYASTKSWIELLLKHEICPWPRIAPWTLYLRIVKSYLIYQPWKHPSNMIKWKGACGMYKALSGV